MIAVRCNPRHVTVNQLAEKKKEKMLCFILFHIILYYIILPVDVLERILLNICPGIACCACIGL